MKKWCSMFSLTGGRLEKGALDDSNGTEYYTSLINTYTYIIRDLP